jgi:hypothetical protein
MLSRRIGCLSRVLLWAAVSISCMVIESEGLGLQQPTAKRQTATSCSSLLWGNANADDTEEQYLPTTDKSRRTILLFTTTTMGAWWLATAQPGLALAADAVVSEEATSSTSTSTTIVKGTVTLASDVVASGSENSALYITCRPDQPDNVPTAILSGTRGKAPPVLAARLPNPTFPLEFTLTAPRDLTPEGASSSSSNKDDDGTATATTTPFWWNKDDLIVSARWDSDGVAATRSPEDLVGRALWKSQGGGADATVEVQLTGRGAFGKFATGGGGSKK